MRKIRQRLLKIIAGVAVWSAVTPIFPMLWVAYNETAHEEIPAPSTLLPDCLLFSAIFFVGFALSALLIRPDGVFRPVAKWISSFKKKGVSAVTLARGACWLLLVLLALLAGSGATTGMGEAVFRIGWAAMMYILSVKAGEAPYNEILTRDVAPRYIITMLAAGALAVLVGAENYLALLPFPAVLFVLSALLTLNQTGLDSVLLNGKRITSALPGNIRRNNLLVILGIALLVGVLFLLRDAIGTSALWALGQLMRGIGWILKWLGGLFRVPSGDKPAATPDILDELDEPGGLGLTGWGIALIVLLGIASLPFIWAGLLALLRKIRKILAWRFPPKKAKHEGSGFFDTSEALQKEEKTKMARRVRPSLSHLSKMQDKTERVRFLYKLTLGELVKKQDIKLSDTTGMVLRKAAQPAAAPLSSITSAYDDVRYGGIQPTEEDVAAIRKKYLELQKTLK